MSLKDELAGLVGAHDDDIPDDADAPVYVARPKCAFRGDSAAKSDKHCKACAEGTKRTNGD